jgi:type I restriction enzyme S subunit
VNLETFFEKFELFAHAPEAVSKLRELFLQLAVRGKLTEQADDESCQRQLGLAEAFRIQKGRRDEPDSEDIPFLIPRNWGWVAVGDTMNMINGKAFKQEEWSTNGTPIIRIQNLNNKNSGFNYCNTEQDPKIHVHDGEFLISWSGTPGTSFGAFIWHRGFAYLNQHIFRCELVTGVFIKEFLRLAINARLDEMISHAQGGVGLRHITKGKLEGIRLPLPPLAEQKRIVAKVDELMALCDRLEVEQQERETKHAALAHASISRFEGAPTPANLEFLFHDAFEIGPGDLRKTILTQAVLGGLVPKVSSEGTTETLSMEELVGKKNLKNGLSLPPTEGTSDYFCLPLSAMKGFSIDCTIGKPVVVTAERAEPYLVKSRDVFIMRGNGSKERVGTAGMVRSKPRNVLFPDLFIRVPLPEDKIDVSYFLIAWNSPITRTALEGTAKTTSGIWKINQGHIAECKIVLPPLPEQRRIVARVDQLMSQVNQLEDQLAKSRVVAEQLLVALIAELISGNVKAQIRTGRSHQ